MGAGFFHQAINFPSSVAANLFLDIYPNAAFAYSFRKLRAAYAGSAVRIRRSSDNAEQDIGFSGEDFDAASAATFISGGSGYIVTWYDQSGNGLDATQATAGDQPIYDATGGPGSLPSMNFVSSDALRTSSSLDMVSYVTSQGTFFGVLTNPTSTGVVFAWNAVGTYPLYLTQQFGSLYFALGSGSSTDPTGGRIDVAMPAGWTTSPHIYEAYRDSSDVQGITVDGASQVTGTRQADIASDPHFLGLGTAEGIDSHHGYLSEVVGWGTDLGSTNRAAARTNINSYYSVF